MTVRAPYRARTSPPYDELDQYSILLSLNNWNYLSDYIVLLCTHCSFVSITGESLVNSILDICVGRYPINITEENFLKLFNIANSNVKILRSVKREVNDFKEIRRYFKGSFFSKK